MIAFTVEGRAVPKGRPRFSNGHTYTPPKTVAYENAVKWQATRVLLGQACPAYPEGDVKLTVTIHLFGKAHPDIDNVVKAVSDALNGIAYGDDRQVSWIDARRVACKRTEQRVEVRIESISELDSTVQVAA